MENLSSKCIDFTKNVNSNYKNYLKTIKIGYTSTCTTCTNGRQTTSATIVKWVGEHTNHGGNIAHRSRSSTSNSSQISCP